MTPNTTASATRSSPRRVEALDITVLSGGPSAEREVSLLSGRAVHEALVRLGHRAIIHDVSPDDLSALDIPADFVFIALHGAFGEDGTVQAELDRRQLRYCGTGAAASRLAMNKVESKRRFIAAGIPTPEHEVVDSHTVAGLAERFDVPAVVKPIDSGSSVDTSIPKSPRALQEAAEQLVSKYGRALIERYIKGPELTVGVLGTQALPVCEIRTKREFYDYQAKYIDDDTEYRFDIDLPTGVLSRVQELSATAHRALGCEVFSRHDWMVDAATREPYILEVNTIPGFTSHSLLPKAAGRVGISFDQLCQRIVELSLAKIR